MAQTLTLNFSESRSIKRERNGQPTDACLYSYHSYFSLVFFIFLSPFFFLVLLLLLYVIVNPLSLLTATTFYTVYHDKIYHFYPSTAFGSLWASFQDYPLACRLPNHYHCTVLVAPRLIPRQKRLVLFLNLFPFSLLSSG